MMIRIVAGLQALHYEGLSAHVWLQGSSCSCRRVLPRMARQCTVQYSTVHHPAWRYSGAEPRLRWNWSRPRATYKEAATLATLCHHRQPLAGPTVTWPIVSIGLFSSCI